MTMQKMKNYEKYKTAEERVKAFNKKCGPCEVANCDRIKAIGCFNKWLDLEAEDDVKIEPCPFCGGECKVIGAVNHRVSCDKCNYESIMDSDKHKVIAAHNRVALASMAEKGEACDGK